MADLDFMSVVAGVGYVVELIGVAVIVLGAAVASSQALRRRRAGDEIGAGFHDFRRGMGRAMLIGLEFLVAGDIIRTVVVPHTLMDVTSLGLLVVIRTILVFTIHLEVEGTWPWQSKSKRTTGDATE